MVSRSLHPLSVVSPPTFLCSLPCRAPFHPSPISLPSVLYSLARHPHLLRFSCCDISLRCSRHFRLQNALILRGYGLVTLAARQYLGRALFPFQTITTIPDGEKMVGRVLAALPFELTRGQKEALEEIMGDLRSGRPMLRLLQGEGVPWPIPHQRSVETGNRTAGGTATAEERRRTKGGRSGGDALDGWEGRGADRRIVGAAIRG
jgi:hypothetical protein